MITGTIAGTLSQAASAAIVAALVVTAVIFAVAVTYGIILNRFPAIAMNLAKVIFVLSITVASLLAFALLGVLTMT